MALRAAAVSIAEMLLRAFTLLAALAATALPALADEVAPTPEPTNSLAELIAEPVSTNAPLTETNTVANVDAPTNSPALLNTATVNFGAMQLRSGFRLQLVATDPFIQNPVAMAFDAAGNLFVAEQATGAANGRITRLHDRNGDGVFDEAKVFAENLASPTALICYGGGVFVASGAQILFLAEPNAEGLATLHREVFGGFETNQAGASPGGGINSFAWGPDNWIHVANAGVRGNITCLTKTTDQTLKLDGYDFAFNPRTLEMILEPGGTSRGVSFDMVGHRYTCSVSRPAQLTVCDPYRAAQNPLYFWPQLTADLTPRGFKLLPLPVAIPITDTNAPAPGVDYVAQARLVTGQFAQASSLFIYRGGSFPKSYANSVFIADPILRLVTRRQLRDIGILSALELPTAERNAEFLRSGDPTFRPVQVVGGPDGTLYVADLARENFDVPGEHGRIWRIHPAGLDAVKSPDLATLKSDALVKLLGSPNAWARDTASRLLFERNEPNTVTLLRKEIRWTWNSVTKLEILNLLDSLGALDDLTLLRALQDKEAAIRENAARLAARFIKDGAMQNAVLSQLAGAANDASVAVRFQAALTLAGAWNSPVPAAIANTLRNSPADPWLQSAVLTGANTGAADMLINLMGDSRLNGTPTGWQFLLQLALMTGQQSTSGLDEVLRRIENSGLNPLAQLTLARTVGDGLHLAGRSFVTTAPDQTWASLGRRALAMALENNSAELRAEAIRFVGVSGLTSRDVSDWVLALLAPGEPQAVQSAAIEALSRFQDPRLTLGLTQRWSKLSAISQREIIARLLTRFDGTMALMTALENNQISRAALSDVQVNFLRNHRDANTAARTLQLYGPLTPSNFATRFADALKLKGSARNGRAIFLQRCAGCHEFNGDGIAFGPSLNSARSRGPEQLLQDILEPNREVSAAYQTQVIQRMDHELLFGLVSESGGDLLLVKQPGGRQFFIPRPLVEDLSKQNWSLMPADAAAGLTLTDLANLLAYLQSAP